MKPKHATTKTNFEQVDGNRYTLDFIPSLKLHGDVAGY
jgi:hypothetical protein